MPAASCAVDRNLNRMQKQLMTEIQTAFVYMHGMQDILEDAHHLGEYKLP